METKSQKTISIRRITVANILPDSTERMRSLLKTLQNVSWATSAVVGIIIIAVAPLIARYWINPGTLDVATY
jgi:hypothetical protein